MDESMYDDTGNGAPEASVPNQNVVLPYPHRQPFFTRLLSTFGLTSRPVRGFGEDSIDAFDQSDDRTQWFEKQMRMAQDRTERYRIFEEMDTFGLVRAILDVHAEEATQTDYDKSVSVWVESKNSKMISSGTTCLRNLQMEDVVMPVTRRMIKHGDEFRRLVYRAEEGVLSWQRTSPDKIVRVQDKYNRLVGYKESNRKYRNKQRDVSWPWDYAHFRFLGADNEDGYGRSLLENLFRPWRQLTLAEDAMLMYRMRRTPDRNAIFIDVGNMDEVEAMQLVNKWRKVFRKTEYVDPTSPNYAKLYNPITPLEDIFLPTRGPDGAARIEQLTGSTSADQIHDLNFLRDMFFGAAKVPKAYFGFEGDINAKATLMQQDVRFARTIKRVRKYVVMGIRTTLDIHYSLLGTEYDFTQAGNEYLVQMTPISFLDEFERLELIQLRMQLVDALANLGTTLRLDPKVWADFVLTDYAKLPEDLVKKLTAKADQPADAGAGGPFASVDDPSGGSPYLSEAQKVKVLKEHGPQMLRMICERRTETGYYPLSKKEKETLAECVHASPALRQVISDITDYAMVDLMEMQTDSSLLPPRGVTGLSDTVDDSKEAVQLIEDLDALKAGTLVEG